MPVLEIELAKVAKTVFGITPRRYRQMANEEIVPPVIKGKIEFIEATKNVIEYYRKLAQSQGDLSLTDERTRLTSLKKQREQLKLEVEKGDLISKEIPRKIFREIISNAKSHLLGLPRRWGEVLAVIEDPRQIEYITREDIYSVLEVMGRTLHDKKDKRGIRVITRRNLSPLAATSKTTNS